MEELYRVLVTPRDAIEVNQLASLSQRLTPSGNRRQFKVGMCCIFWVHLNAFGTDITRHHAKEFWDAPDVSVNTLGTLLQQL